MKFNQACFDCSNMENGMLLDGSSADVTPYIEEAPRMAKKLTVWSTGFTTVTITTTSYLTGTTVTVSALCTVTGMSQSCFG